MYYDYYDYYDFLRFFNPNFFLKIIKISVLMLVLL